MAVQSETLVVDLPDQWASDGQPDTDWPVGTVSRLALSIHLATLAGGLAFLLVLNRRLWFYGDDWDFLAGRGLNHPRWGLFFPHNEHWSTLPILLWRALITIDGAHQYWLYLLPTLLAHVALGHVLWRVALRAGASVWVSTSLVALFLVDGAIYENITWAFLIGFVAPVLLGWTAIFLTTSRQATLRRDLMAALLLTAGLMCSTIGVAMSAVTGLCVLIARNWRAAVRVVAVPAVTYLIWFHYAGSSSYTYTLSNSVFRDLTLFVGTGLSNAADKTLGVPGLGAAAVVALVSWAVLQSRAAHRGAWMAAPVGGVLGIVVLYLVIATGRTVGGLSWSTPSRYIYVATALAVPGIACALTQLNRPYRVSRVLGLAIAGLMAIHLIATLHESLGFRARQVLTNKVRIAAAIEVVQSGGPILVDAADPTESGPLRATDLARLVREGNLPQPKPVPRSVLVSEATLLQTSITTTPLLPFNGKIIATSGLILSPTADDCQKVTAQGTPEIAVRAQPGGTSVTLSLATAGTVNIDLSGLDPNYPAQQALTVAPRQRVYANFATMLGTPRIILPTGSTGVICLTHP